MNYDDVQGIIEHATALATDGPLGLRTYSDGRTLPTALGTGRRGDQFRLAIFGSDPVFAERLSVIASHEADVYLIDRVERRITSVWAKKPHEIVGIGRQIGPSGFGWVGTGGILVRAADDASVRLQITNEHVIGEGAPRGRVMHQGGRSYGAVWGRGVIRYDVSNPWDVGSTAVDRTRRINGTFEQGIDNNLRGIRRMTPADIGRRFTNTGQTEGTLFGSCIAVGVRELAVGYDGGVARFHGQAAFVGENGQPFSVSGHSGSTIVCMEDEHATALLFAGGRDERGRDVTFGAEDLPGAITAAGGVPQLLAA